MTLSRQNLKIMKAERPTGGRMSGIEVQSGALNNLFPNLSTIGFTAGSLELAKCYGWVNSNDTSRFQDAFFCVTKNPDNPDVTVFIFSTEDWFDYIQAHKSYLASYLATGPVMLQWIPTYGGMSDGSQMIQLWGDSAPNVTMPNIGDTYVLIQDEGQSSQKEKAFKIAALTHQLQQFGEQAHPVYWKNILTVTMNSALPSTFVGEPVSFYPPSIPRTGLHTTFASGGARVYGLMALAQAISAGQGYCVVDSIYKQIVPASVSDTLLVNQAANGNSTAFVPAADGYLQFDYDLDFGPGLNLHLGQPSVVGTVSIDLGGGNVLTESKGSLWSGSTEVARINQGLGLVTPLAGAPTFTGAKTVRFRPAGAVSQPMQSASLKVTQANQSRFWSYRLPMRPAVGSILIYYLAGGTWYALRDNGVDIAGDQPSFGAASLDSENYLSMSLGVAPDIDSRILIYWSEDVLTFNRAGTTVQKAKIIITTNLPFDAGTMTLAWNDGIADRTATLAADRTISGDATGYAIPSQKTIILQPNIVPPKGTPVNLSYTPYTKAVESFDFTVVSAGTASFTLQHGNIKPHSVKLAYVSVKSNIPPAYNPGPGSSGLTIG